MRTTQYLFLMLTPLQSCFTVGLMLLWFELTLLSITSDFSASILNILLNRLNKALSALICFLLLILVAWSLTSTLFIYNLMNELQLSWIINLIET